MAGIIAMVGMSDKTLAKRMLGTLTRAALRAEWTTLTFYRPAELVNEAVAVVLALDGGGCGRAARDTQHDATE